MTNDMITNPDGFCDDLCNQIILYSSTVAKELEITYGELWIIIMVLTFVILIWYLVLNYLSLYANKQKICKMLFWISIVIIGFLIVLTIGDFGVYCKYDM